MKAFNYKSEDGEYQDLSLNRVTVICDEYVYPADGLAATIEETPSLSTYLLKYDLVKYVEGVESLPDKFYAILNDKNILVTRNSDNGYFKPGYFEIKDLDLDIDIYNTLVDGYKLFQNCKWLPSFNKALPVLTIGDNMFYACTSLTSFTSELPALVSSSDMFFRCRQLKKFEINLPLLTNSRRMFQSCSELTYFNSELPVLTNSYQMFASCTGLTSFNIELPLLTDGGNMFLGCTGLTSFNIELPLLRTGVSMFANCSGLTSFTPALSALTNGSMMFARCKLDKPSVLNILATIPIKPTSSTLNLGINKIHEGDLDIAAAIAAAQAKMWSITITYNV